MSKHHAVEEPQVAEISWLRQLAKPAETLPPVSSSSYYASLVPRAPRHASPADDVEPVADCVPAAAQSAPIRRISASQVDTVIGHLDALPDGRSRHGAPDPNEMLSLSLLIAQPEPEQSLTDQLLSGHSEPAVHRTVNLPEGNDDGLEERRPVAEGAGASHSRLRSRLRKPVLIGAAATVCALTIGGGTFNGVAASPAQPGAPVQPGSSSAASIAGTAKTVSVVVDGQLRTVTTDAGSVGGVLAAAGIALSVHDSVSPATSAPISAGSTIVVNRGRLLTLTVDGQPRRVWTTARTVEQALAQLGAGSSELAVAANRSRAIPLTGLALNASSLHKVGVSVGGQSPASATTTAKTVGELLAQRKVTLGPYDAVSPAVSTKLTDGLVIRVNRITITNSVKTIALAQPNTKTVDDPAIPKGTTTIVQQGRPGQQVITYTVTIVNGKQTSKVETGRHTAVEPIATETHIGTKTAFTYVGNEVFTNDHSFGVNWDGLAFCESTHNPKAVNANPSAGLPTYGLFQFDIPTWESVGGSGNPMDASPEEQLMRAKLLYQSRGLEPWACRDAAH